MKIWGKTELQTQTKQKKRKNSRLELGVRGCADFFLFWCSMRGSRRSIRFSVWPGRAMGGVFFSSSSSNAFPSKPTSHQRVGVIYGPVDLAHFLFLFQKVQQVDCTNAQSRPSYPPPKTLKKKRKKKTKEDSFFFLFFFFHFFMAQFCRRKKKKREKTR